MKCTGVYNASLEPLASFFFLRSRYRSHCSCSNSLSMVLLKGFYFLVITVCTALQLTPDNSKPQEKSKKVPVIGNSGDGTAPADTTYDMYSHRKN